jgi:para-nitrobenzyl esterase
LPPTCGDRPSKLKIMKNYALLLLISVGLLTTASAQKTTRAKTVNGTVEGIIDSNNVRTFKGVPFAQPPVGQLRWKAPQPVINWQGVRKTVKFGPRAMQLPLFGDMNFRSDGMSEDCLYLNVWTPAKSANEKLPVLVYFYGGGAVAGDGSEPRYDGQSMAEHGIVAITVNYRLGVFGFLTLPELTAESPYHGSGDYAYLDQNAALKWVQKNIAAFGGDPSRVTIGGESAGSTSVSVQVASPLSKGLFSAAIGESGAMVGSSKAIPLADGEQIGTKFEADLGKKSLAELRAIPAEELLQATAKAGRFPAVIDGHFLPKTPMDIYAKGEQSDVPLLAGWNSAEVGYSALLGKDEPTIENFKKAVEKLYGDKAQQVLDFYPAKTDEEVAKVATELASDRFIAYNTWKWIDLHSKTNGKPVYRYLYAHPRPAMTAAMGNVTPGLAGGVVKNDGSGQTNKVKPALGASHSSEIEYALGNLYSNKVFQWDADDYKVSKTMQAFFVNFIKNHDPNGPGLPTWTTIQASKPHVMVIDVETKSEPEKGLRKYQFIDTFYYK